MYEQQAVRTVVPVRIWQLLLGVLCYEYHSLAAHNRFVGARDSDGGKCHYTIPVRTWYSVIFIILPREELAQYIVQSVDRLVPTSLECLSAGNEKTTRYVPGPRVKCVTGKNDFEGTFSSRTRKMGEDRNLITAV